MEKILLIILTIFFFSCKHAAHSNTSSSVSTDEKSIGPHDYKIEMVETKLHLGAAPKVCYFKYVYPVAKMLEVATKAELIFIEKVNNVLEAKKLTPKPIEKQWYDVPCIEGNPSSEIGFESKITYSIHDKYISFLGDFWTYTPGAAHPMRSITAPVVDINSGELVSFSQIAKPDDLEKIKEAIQSKADQAFDSQADLVLEFVKNFDDIQFTATDEDLTLHIIVSHALGDVYSPNFTWDEAQVFLK